MLTIKYRYHAFVPDVVGLPVIVPTPGQRHTGPATAEKADFRVIIKDNVPRNLYQVCET